MRKSAKIVRIPGVVHSSGGKPLPDVVSRLEELCQKAKRGEILGLAYVVVEGANTCPKVTTGWASGCADGNLLLSGVPALGYRIAKLLDEME